MKGPSIVLSMVEILYILLHSSWLSPVCVCVCVCVCVFMTQLALKWVGGIVCVD